jgi:hypothetical protein
MSITNVDYQWQNKRAQRPELTSTQVFFPLRVACWYWLVDDVLHFRCSTAEDPCGTLETFSDTRIICLICPLFWFICRVDRFIFVDDPE